MPRATTRYYGAPSAGIERAYAVARLMMTLAVICSIPAAEALADDDAASHVAVPLGDMTLGPSNAAVTVIEYASMTCPHCAAFHSEVYPKLKAAYIDTGKVRFVFREFPLDIKAAAGSMLARCGAKGDAKIYFATIDALFRMQNDWVPGNSPAALKRIAKQAGVGEQEFQSCLANEDMLGAIKQIREDAVNRLNVRSTPSFFINGSLLEEDATFEVFEKAIDSKLGN